MNYQEKLEIATSIGEEVINRSELGNLIQASEHVDVVAYDGFELSGIPHLAQVFMKAHNVNQLTRCGIKFKFWIADYFTLLNNKMDGDMEKIRVVGNYMIEVWKASGMDMTNVEFLWASDEINKDPDLYWRIVMDVCKKNNLTRMKRCIPILGRGTNSSLQFEYHKQKSEALKKVGRFKEALEEMELATQFLKVIDGEIPLAYPMYAAMQAADVMFIPHTSSEGDLEGNPQRGAHICQLGMDQKKVNMLVREYTGTLEHDKNPVVPLRPKPVIISHHMLPGLDGHEKASKSKPSSGIFVNDTPAQVKKKIRKSFCAPKDITGPVMERIKYIIFPWLVTQNRSFEIQRKRDPDISFTSFEEFENSYAVGTVHPADLKPAVIRELNRLLDPIRNHFETDPRAKALLELVESYKITR